ncbi:MAG: ATP-binding protein, partial [Spartobacteria bacterium]
MPTKSPNKPESSDPLEIALAQAMSGVSKKKKLLIGVSGGRDSMVLLSALRALGFERLVVCHLDHSLRGKASRADAASSRDLRLAAAKSCVEARADSRA